VIDPETPVTVTEYVPMEVEEDVLTVNVAVTGPLPVTLGEDGLTVQVAGEVPALEVKLQARSTTPVKPFDGVMVIVEVLPEVAPATTLMLPLFESAKVGTDEALTVKFTWVVAVMLLLEESVPFTVITYAPAVVAEVVSAVRTAVAAAVPVMSTEETMLQVAGELAPDGLDVTAQERFTGPVNAPEGVTVMVDVLPVVAPAVTVIMPLFERAKPCEVLEPVTTACRPSVWMNLPVAASFPVIATL
jgi:hypothetical protein